MVGSSVEEVGAAEAAVETGLPDANGEAVEAARESETTVLVEGLPGGASGKPAQPEEPVLSLVSVNPRTAVSFDLVRGSLTVVPDLPSACVALRTVRVSCGRDPVNALAISDNRVSLVHFTVRVRAARGGFVALDLTDQSSNGTWINGKRIGNGRSVAMAVGDQILVLPACHVGRNEEVGYMLLHDSRGAHCGSRQASPSAVASCGPKAVPSELPPAPKGISVPRSLEDDLRCGICTDALYHCLTLVPCGHNFCTTCLCRWRRRSYACPQCRATVQQAVRNTAMDRVVETFITAHPEAARSPRELATLEHAEKDQGNAAMLRWLLHPYPVWAGAGPEQPAGPAGPAGPGPRGVATPQRQGQARHPSSRSQEPVNSSACVVS